MTPHAITFISARTLTAVEFEHLAAVSPALEWFANLHNARIRRAYQNDITDFCRLEGIVQLQRVDVDAKQGRIAIHSYVLQCDSRSKLFFKLRQ